MKPYAISLQVKLYAISLLLKPYAISLLLLASLSPLAGIAQLNNGGLNAMFGIDADTRSNYMRFGPFPGAVLSDDWFASASPRGRCRSST